jgi:hypothetical protein
MAYYLAALPVVYFGARGTQCKCTDVRVTGFDVGVSAVNGAIINLVDSVVLNNILGLFADGTSKIKIPLNYDSVEQNLMQFSMQNRTDWNNNVFQSVRNKLEKQQRGEILVPEEYEFNDAINFANTSNNVTTIILQKGTFIMVDNLKIIKQMNIVGTNGTILKCGIEIDPGIKEACVIKNITIEANKNGIIAKSSVIMENVLVQNCNEFGMYIKGKDLPKAWWKDLPKGKDLPIKGTFVNVRVQNCGWSGVTAENASILLMDTYITKNGKQLYNAYGLQAVNSLVELVDRDLNDVTYDNENGRNIRKLDSKTTRSESEEVGLSGGGSSGGSTKLRFL